MKSFFFKKNIRDDTVKKINHPLNSFSKSRFAMVDRIQGIPSGCGSCGK